MKSIKQWLYNQSWYWKLSSWMRRSSPIYINSLNISKCYREWRAVKKYFRRPRWKLAYRGYGMSGGPLLSRLLRIEVHPLQWKTKYGEFRREEDPMASLTIFNYTWAWRLVPNKNPDNEDISTPYYEGLLYLDELLNYKHMKEEEAVYKCIAENTWRAGLDSKRTIDAYCMLTYEGRTLYNIWSLSHKSDRQSGSV